MAVATSKSAPGRRFELPALEFNFSSLTEGTDIPPPLPSPVQEVPTPPQTPPPASENKENGSQTKKTNGATPPTAGTKRPADGQPLSPASSSRQGSIRRLFSRNLLNNAYVEGEARGNANANANGGSHAAAAINRPMSRNAGSIMDEKKAKRQSWFRRLRTGDNVSKRSSVLYDDPSKSQQTPQSPPPPMIPELSDLEAKVDPHDDGSLGSDLFKNIK